MKQLIDIRKLPDLIDIINLALTDGKIIELKNESRKADHPNIVAVEINRVVRTRKSKEVQGTGN